MSFQDRGEGAPGGAPTAGGIDWRDVAGKIWNAPNTAVGLLYGGVGMAAGEAAHLMGLQEKAPRVFLGNNGVQFVNNPLGGRSAITLGNATVSYRDPYDPSDGYWHYPDGSPILENGHTNPQHEIQHTYQGQQLGPLYLPSNLLGGLNAVLRGKEWHDDANWNETGPQMNPPRPWPGTP